MYFSCRYGSNFFVCLLMSTRRHLTLKHTVCKRILSHPGLKSSIGLFVNLNW